MRDWADVLPPDVAKRQRTYDRAMKVWRLRMAGLTFREVGEIMGVGRYRASQLFARAEWFRDKGAPIERYFAGDDLLDYVAEARFPRRQLRQAAALDLLKNMLQPAAD